jgi:hypothetical protein
MDAVDELSEALVARVVMALPDREDWLPGVATVTVLVTVQPKVAERAKPAESVAVAVTE